MPINIQTCVCQTERKRGRPESGVSSVMCEKLLIVVLVERGDDKVWIKCALPVREEEEEEPAAVC